MAIPSAPAKPAIPEGIVASRRAFLDALPELLVDEALKGKWIAYCGKERIGIDDSDAALIRKCMRRGLNPDQYIVDVIEPKSPEPEEVDFSSSWR